VELEGSFPRSQQPATDPYQEKNVYSPHNSTQILSSHSCLGLQNSLLIAVAAAAAAQGLLDKSVWITKFRGEFKTFWWWEGSFRPIRSKLEGMDVSL